MQKWLCHGVATGLVAAIAALWGLRVLAPDGVDWRLDARAVGASVVFWVAIGNVYRTARAWGACVPYFAVLSLLMGCLVVAPPWSFFIVLSKPVFSLGLALVTSVAVYAISLAAGAGG
jgi:hypothetical protein